MEVNCKSLKIGRPLIDLLANPIEEKAHIHPWLPSGLTLLAGKAKSGKATLAEQIAEEVSINQPVLYLALEYNARMAQARFKRFNENHDIYIILEGEVPTLKDDGKRKLQGVLDAIKPSLVIIDVLAKIKRHNNGHYDAEYAAMSEIKELLDQSDVSGLILTHSGKPSAHESSDPFDKIIGSTALQGVPDNLMVLATGNGHTKLSTKGRLIFPREIILDFKEGVYSERSGVASDLEDRAPIQAEILKLLEGKELRVAEIANLLGRAEPQISIACRKLFDEGRIIRDNRSQPYRLKGSWLL